jgi:predicted RNase H-like HicB family nuclease
MDIKSSSTYEETVIAAGKEYVCQFHLQRRGGYLVTCRKFLPLAAYGDTLVQARAEARQGIEAWIEYAECREFV